MPRRADQTTLTIDDLTFVVRRSAKRRTIGISVERGGGLRLAVPSRCSQRTIGAAVRSKLGWVRLKLAEYEAMGPVRPPRCFADGDRLPYRGRHYGLRVVTGHDDAPLSVALRRGRFELTLPHSAGDADARGEREAGGEQPSSEQARAAFVAWYTDRAREVLAVRVQHFTSAVRAAPSDIRVRDMGRRWGTCNTRNGVISFHWEIILLPTRILDYLVVHEVAHLHEPNHGPRFWSRVEAVLPDWRESRRWLRTDAPAFLL
jgi:predicted metal-dependent hydrolase